jgi:hypothetical protein
MFFIKTIEGKYFYMWQTKVDGKLRLDRNLLISPITFYSRFHHFTEGYEEYVNQESLKCF